MTDYLGPTQAANASTDTEGRASATPTRVLSARWWTGGRGWSGLAQWPNPALVVWLIAVIVGWTGIVDDASRSDTLAGVGDGALIVWSVDELVRGSSPVRRLLGAIVLAVQLVRLLA